MFQLSVLNHRTVKYIIYTVAMNYLQAILVVHCLPNSKLIFL